MEQPLHHDRISMAFASDIRSICLVHLVSFIHSTLTKQIEKTDDSAGCFSEARGFIVPAH